MEERLSKEEARELVRQEILLHWNIEGDEPIILDDLIIEKDFGWVFFYHSRKYIETEDFKYYILGNAPIIVNKFDGSLNYTGTAYETDYYIKEYEKKLKQEASSNRVQTIWKSIKKKLTK
ncbi:MAG TPA: YrhB domain-containing protein [Pyrinomonadaceae bacterium]|nr:YrhB domain-containing protein [Pyrinomonadaceae bacterium]